MIDDYFQNDDDLVRHLRDHVSTLAAPSQPPLEAITRRGRSHRRRQTAARAALGIPAVAAGTTLAFVLGAAPGTSHFPGAGTEQSAASASSTPAIQTAAFTLTSNADGTDTLTLPLNQVLDPAIFQRALTQHHIPALVKSGVVCTSRLEPVNPVFSGIFTLKPQVKPHAPAGPTSPGAASSPGQLRTDAVVVINPAKIPSGTELFFGYSSNERAMALTVIDVNSYTCKTQPPLPPAPSPTHPA